MTQQPAGQEPPALEAALRGRCPRCGKGKLFVGLVRFGSNCPNCGLDLQQFNVGDGPAAFLILIVGAVLTVGALTLDAALEPAWWVHLIWVPVGLGLTAVGLRIAKAWLLGAEYRNRAREGRLVR